MKCLITGVAGFVGSYLLETLKDRYSSIHGIVLGAHEKAACDTHPCDIRNFSDLDEIIRKIAPDSVFHLAAQPFVPIAIKNPQETLDINVRGTLNILESLKNLGKPVKLIYISSSDVYGNQPEARLPLKESCPPAALNPYSISKLAAETYALGYSRYAPNLKVMIARPFNHIGVGQRDEFVVPNFFRQIFAAEKKGDSISVGDLSSTRDFLDVRDVVRGYSCIDEKGESGEIYNICSGKETRIREILDTIISLNNSTIKIKIDQDRIRAVETFRMFGDNSKIKALGWSQQISLEESLKDIYQSLRG